MSKPWEEVWPYVIAQEAQVSREGSRLMRGRLADPEQRARFFSTLDSEPEKFRLKATGAFNILALLVGLGAGEDSEHALRAFGRRHPGRAVEVIRALAQWPFSEETAAYVREIALDPDADSNARALAVSQLASSGDDEATDALAEVLSAWTAGGARRDGISTSAAVAALRSIHGTGEPERGGNSEDPGAAPDGAAAAEVVGRTTSEGIQLASIDVVRGLAERARDTAENDGDEALAGAVLAGLDRLESGIRDGRASDAELQETLRWLTTTGHALMRWYAYGHTLFDLGATIIETLG